MKNTLLLITSLISVSAFAQTTVPLPKGKEITIVTTTAQNIDMGMQMGTTSTITNKINIINVDPKTYTLSSKLTKFLFKGDMLGKETNYDSDKAEDRNSEEGKQFSGMLDKIDTVAIDIETGIPLKQGDATVVTESENPMAGMMGSMTSGNTSSIASSIIFKLPVAAAKGNTWTDSTNLDGMKSVVVYKIDDIVNGLATITSTGVINGTTTMDLQGNSFDMTMDTKSTGSIVLDVKTNLVKKRLTVANIDGNIQMAGQSLPFTSKTTTESTYQ